MFVTGCQDSSLIVACAAMQATTAYINSVPSDAPEVMMLKPTLTPILQLMHRCLETDDEIVKEGLAVFSECLIMSQPLINDHIEPLIQFITNVMQSQNENVEIHVKVAASQALCEVMQYRPKLVAKKQLVAPTLQALANIIAQGDSAAGSLFSLNEDGKLKDEDDDDDEEDENLQQVAQSCVDTMALHIPSKYFVEPALQVSSQGMQSPVPAMRKAGCAILGIIAEGCCDAIRQLLPSLMPHLLAAAVDQDATVKETAYFTLGMSILCRRATFCL